MAALPRLLVTLLIAMAAIAARAAGPAIEIVQDTTAPAFALAGAGKVTPIVIDRDDYPVVALAAAFFADDIARVTGSRPAVVGKADEPFVIIAGTVGHNALIDRMATEGKLPGIEKIRSRWEATLWQIVDDPLPGVKRALVIAGSDRRGAAYGLMGLSERIGVSPWNWWADVPVKHADTLAVRIAALQVDAPEVRYRGIFINDEDWGLFEWASKTFDPEFGNVGPKTYEKVFELMLRLRLNYLWPAMHECSAEFASRPENIALADRYGIVAGSSHCEPMLCNNIHWDEAKQGKWDYTLNRDAIHDYWAESAKTRGNYEAVWTLGIRGIHDRAMQGPPEIPTRINIVSQVFHDQRELIDTNVSHEWGPVAQAFVPYKEVLPIYDSGLKVPDDVTLVWVDDNFGYIRRLSGPVERARAGGAGVYWHLSYYGGPHSYTWINTTPPALMWEEFHKAWDNGARRLWVINVGDIKPMEIGIDFFSRFAWSPTGTGPGSQPAFLRDFAERNFGGELATPIASLLGEHYRLGTIRKPELMERPWALSLTASEASSLEAAYRRLLEQEKALAARIPTAAHDAYYQIVGFPAQVLARTGLIFLADREAQLGHDAATNEASITQLRAELEIAVAKFNNDVAGGKWNHMMPGLVTGKDLMRWNSQVRWPWGDNRDLPASAGTTEKEVNWRDAASADRNGGDDVSQWTEVSGLGATARAMALLPVVPESSWHGDAADAPFLEFDLDLNAGDDAALIDFLPTFRLYPGKQVRVAVRIDDQTPIVVEVPGSSGREDEVGTVRSVAVQTNYVRATVPLGSLAEGRHTLRISAVDPGAVIDRVAIR